MQERPAVTTSAKARAASATGKGGIMKAWRWLVDQILRAIQQNCTHPDEMVASDILEGSGYLRDLSGLSIPYCRRCGALKIFYAGRTDVCWRRPDPNLWRGK